MKFKIVATHYVEATDRYSAEFLVEQQSSQPDQIDSLPAGQTPFDIVMFGVSEKLAKEHHDIFFNSRADDEYANKCQELRERTKIWLDSILEQVITSNEENWA